MLKWSKDLDAHPATQIFSSPVVVDGMVIVGVASVELAFNVPDYTFRGSIVALDQDTGDEVWRTYITKDDANGGAGGSVWSSAAIDHDRGLMYIGVGTVLRAAREPTDRFVAGARLPHGDDGVEASVHCR